MFETLKNLIFDRKRSEEELKIVQNVLWNLNRWSPNKIHPFGGKIDNNENPYDGAVREIKEEVGINIKNLKIEAIILELTDEKDLPVNWLVFHFSADYDSGEIKESEEGEVVYLTAEEIKSADLFPSVKSIIDNIAT